jgi:prepilin-type N-terminal cleavage/methylation domain-containing protein/prepilin-type processing-associated H-X9-DG protein
MRQIPSGFIERTNFERGRLATSTAPRPFTRAAFTLIELLVVLAVIAVLAALLLPALASGQREGRKAGCLSNLRQLGIAATLYASDNSGVLPFGPKAGAFTSPLDFYPSTGAPTSLISLANGAPVGLGLMLSQQLGSQKRALFCPGSDQPMDIDGQLANVGVRQAQCSFYYRHAGNTQIFDTTSSNPPTAPKLEALGNNRNGLPIRALVTDVQFLCSPGMATFGISPSTHHQGRVSNTLHADGHAISQRNTDQRFTVNLGGSVNLYTAFDLILKVFEVADSSG